MNAVSEDTTPHTSIDTLVARLRAIAAQYPLLRADRAAGIGWTIYSRMPNWSAEDPLLITGRQTFWMFAVDDLSDNATINSDILRDHFDHYRAITKGLAPRAGDERAELIAGIAVDLQALPLWPVAGPHWQDAVARLLAGMEGEHDPQHLSLEAYLDRGTWSVGVPVDGWTLLLLLDTETTAAQLPVLRTAILAGARVVRLANDLATAAREQQEGKTGLLTLLANEHNPHAVARQLLLDAEHVWRHAMGQVATRNGRFEACFTAGIEAMVALYRRTDYHEFEEPSE